MHELSVSSNAKENSIILQKPVEYLNLKSKALLRFVGSTLTSSSTTLTILLKLNIELLQKNPKFDLVRSEIIDQIQTHVGKN